MSRNYQCSIDQCRRSLKSNARRLRHEEDKHGHYDSAVSRSCNVCGKVFYRPSGALFHATMSQHISKEEKRERRKLRKKQSKQAKSFATPCPVSKVQTLSSAQIFRPPVSTSKLSKLTSELEVQEYLKTIRPSDAFDHSARAAVGSLVSFLQNNVEESLRPSEVYKGGSFGKSTSLEGKSDIDLVLYLREDTCKDVPELKGKMSGILQNLSDSLKKHGACIDTMSASAHGIEVRLRGHGSFTHNVDILPAVDLLKKDTPRGIYREMKRQNQWTREFYSSALSKLQVEFVKNVPGRVNDLIRLVKSWKKEAFKADQGTKWPTSYVFELITIHAWQEADEPPSFDLRRGMHSVLQTLLEYRKLKVVFPNDNYDEEFARTENSSEPYYVIDPANPFNNTMRRFMSSWSDVADKARDFIMGSAMFANIPGSRYSW